MIPRRRLEQIEFADMIHGTNLIGVQVCNLWREGHHIGWDWISGCADRVPIIGLFDEGNPEAADWQIKFLVEPGGDFR